jgi:hypothetical protein
MTTDEDILAALDGHPGGKSKALAEATLSSLQSDGFGHDRIYDNAILEALTQTGESLDAVAIWAAREAAAAATKTLSEAIMREDGSKGIYLAESEAKEIAEEAYAEAAKRSTSEVERQNTVARVTAKLSEGVTRRTAGGRKPLRTAAEVAAKTTTIANYRGTSRVVIKD